MAKKKTIHYVNNKEFLQAIVERKTLIKEAESVGEPPPQISNYLGECILKIANHLSYRPNFINYTYREEMISDGIENCLQYIDRFDPAKSSNPFAYFTQIIYYALKESNIESSIAVQAHDSESDYQQQFVEMLDKYTFHQDDK